MKHFNWFLAILLSSAALVACQTQNVLDQTEVRYANQGEHCSRTRSQGVHRMGSVGGVGLNHPSNITVKPEQVADPGYLAARLAPLYTFKQPTNDIVIVVADDFGKARNPYGQSVFTVDESLFSLGLESLGSVEATSHELREALEGELDSLLETAKLSHGALTFNMLVDLLSQMPGVKRLSLAQDRVVFGFGQAEITVQAAEVSGLDTSEITDVLEQLVNSYTEKGVTQFVFNFSFTLEPCTEPDAPRNKPINDLSPRPEDDPLYAFIHPRPGTSKTTKLFLASAGNNGEKVAGQPANWPAVVGVSASKVKPLKSFAADTLAGFSNHGEIMAPGSWLKLTDPFGRNGVGHDAAEVILEGTSFSVLAATAFSALDLTQTTPRCGLNAKTMMPRLAQSGDINRTLESAVVHCQGFKLKP